MHVYRLYAVVLRSVGLSIRYVDRVLHTLRPHAVVMLPCVSEFVLFIVVVA